MHVPAPAISRRQNLAIRVDYREKKIGSEEVVSETRYYLTSLDPSSVSPQELLRLIREHWEVERVVSRRQA